MPTTWNPAPANSMASGKPTYPCPRMATMAFRRLSRVARSGASGDVVVVVASEPRVRPVVIEGSFLSHRRRRPLPPEDDLDGVEQDAQVERGRLVLDVVEIVSHL